MSRISDSLKRVAEQRAGRKQPPVVPRRLAGQEIQFKKRRLLLLGLTILLAGAVIGVVVYGVIQWRVGERTPAEAVTASPQQVIFDKITPPAKPLRKAADSEAPPSRDGHEEQRTPVKPKVVQVAIQQEPVSTEEGRQPKAPPAEEEKAEETSSVAATKKPEPVQIAGIKRGRPLNTKKTGLVDLHAETTAEAGHLYRKAVGYQRAMKWQEAINAYRKVIKYEPMSAEVYNIIGVCYEKQGNLKMAGKSYEKAISINPRFYRSYNNLGIIYYKLKNFDKARAAYEQALQLNPGNSQSEINLALVYERLRRGGLARRTLERVLANDPGNAEAHYNLGRMLEGQGQDEEAITHYRQFLASNPSAYPQLREKVKDRVRTLEETSSN